MCSYYVPPKLSAPTLTKWLDSTRRFDSHYNGFLFNHLAHNFVVIAASSITLKRSPDHLETKMKWWSDFYISHHSLESAPARSVDSSMPIISEENWSTTLDKSLVNYPAYLAFFDNLLASDERTISSVLGEYVPTLGRGLIGSALHGIIHLGFAVEVNHKGMVSEGLANLCTVFTPLTSSSATTPSTLWIARQPAASLAPPPSSLPTKGIIDTARGYFREAAASGAHADILRLCMLPEYVALGVGAFQRKVLAFSNPTAGHLAAQLNKHFPVSLAEDTSSAGRSEDNQEEAGCESWLRDIREAQALIAAAYLASDGEFFVVHGVTSLHAVLVLLPHLSPAQQRDLLMHWLRAVLVVYVAVGLPGLERLLSLLEEWQEREGEEEQHRSECGESTLVVATAKLVGEVSGDGREEEGNDMDEHKDASSGDDELWGTLLSLSQLSTDEHVSKGVYVMWRWSQWEGQSSHRAHRGDVRGRAHSLQMFRRAAVHQLRPVDGSGEVNTPQENLWFAD